MREVVKHTETLTHSLTHTQMNDEKLRYQSEDSDPESMRIKASWNKIKE